MNIKELKGTILVLMFFVTFICSVIPVFFVNHIRQTHDPRRRNRYQAILSYMSCIAGGVFMGTCILDLFPDVQQQIDILINQYTISKPFPVAEFIVVFGFLLVLTMEQIVLDYKESFMYKRLESNALPQHNQQVEHNLHLDYSLSGITDSCQLRDSARNPSTYRSNQNYEVSHTACGNENESHYVATSDHDHHDFSTHSPLRSLLLLFALSLHAVFEGMAVGLQRTIDNVVALFMVVIFHKGTLALSLSINMVQSRLTIKQIMLANIFFCLTAPLGLAVGLGIMEIKSNVLMALLSGALQGIACGTFLYVTFFEVLPHEMNTGGNRLLKLKFILLGFAIVCFMLYIAPESEKYQCYRL